MNNSYAWTRDVPSMQLIGNMMMSLIIARRVLAISGKAFVYSISRWSVYIRTWGLCPWRLCPWGLCRDLCGDRAGAITITVTSYSGKIATSDWSSCKGKGCVLGGGQYETSTTMTMIRHAGNIVRAYQERWWGKDKMTYPRWCVVGQWESDWTTANSL